jgi:DNA repair protein RadC
MPKNSKAPSKKSSGTKKKAAKPAYLREIQIKFKKKRVKAGFAVGKKIAGAQQVYELFSDMQNETKEKLIVISLDVKLKILCFEVVAIGSVNTVFARPFEVVRSAILVNAYGLIVVHNHPSGDTKPGLEDKLFTRELKKLTDTGGAELHDHIIIGDGTYFSFAEEGLMAKM